MLIAFSTLSPLAQRFRSPAFNRNYLKRMCFSRCEASMKLINTLTRRAFLRTSTAISIGRCMPVLANASIFSERVANGEENVVTTTTGLRYYDFRIGTVGEAIEEGDTVRFHLTTGTTGARNGWKLASTYDGEALIVKIGDGSIVPGLEEAMRGMKVGGRRRALVPPELGYKGTTKQGPIPIEFASFQRFKNIYLNPRRAFIPDGKFHHFQTSNRCNTSNTNNIVTVVVFDIEVLKVTRRR